MTAARFIVADVFDGLASIEDGSVDLVVTSPPFLALRSYLPADHPDKAKEIGHEATPAEFLDTLLAVTAELRRVLAPHGSICVELGDTYAGSGGERAAYGVGDDYRPARSGRDAEAWPLAKSKALIPELYRIALAYGINPLTGQESPAGRWRIRNVVTWCRPNPPVGALGDKWRPATSDIVIACTSDKRYWDDLATRHEPTAKPQRYFNTKGKHAGTEHERLYRVGRFSEEPTTLSHPAGAPLLDYWELPPGGYPGSHYAVYPPALIEPLIKAMAPPKVCRTCGEPSRRIVETINAVGHAALRKSWYNGADPRDKRRDAHHDVNKVAPDVAEKVTVGWTDCGHNTWRPAVVLDPFAGTGTTLAVATGHGHDAIGIDLDERNYELALERVGPLVLGPPEKPHPRAGVGS